MNLFLPVYRHLEADVVKLTDSIFFDDYQLKVYSLDIGDLLIRCVIEIEAISKELYLRLGGPEHPIDNNGDQRDLYFDTDCIKMLVDRWDIDKKKLQITNSNMYFSPAKAVITPLHKAHKRGTSSSQWQQAYQTVKHYRSKSIKRATLENLLNALGALYILNLYYSDESFWLETPIKDRREYTMDSKIFTPFICDATKIELGRDMGDANMQPIVSPSPEESIYVKKMTDEAFKSIHEVWCKYDLNILTKLQLSKEYLNYKKEHPEIETMDIQKRAECIGINYIEMLVQESRVIGKSLGRINEKEVVLNKQNGIYPTLLFSDYLSSSEGQKYMTDFVNSLQGKEIILPKKQN